MLKKVIRGGWVLIAASSLITGTVVLLREGFIDGKAYAWFIICLVSVVMLLAKNLRRRGLPGKRKKVKN
jgi:uncharacterized membrane protein